MNQGYLHIDGNVFDTLLAISEEEQSQGLMYQSWPPPVMSFLYPHPKLAQFWMKNTPSPLDIVFSCNGKITQICKGEPYSTAIVGDYDLSDLVVELPYGTVKKLGISQGSDIEIFKPSKIELQKIYSKYFPYYK